MIGCLRERRHSLQQPASAQTACIKADIAAKLRLSLLRQFRGLEADQSPGERCLHWRESNNNKFHTIPWRGPAGVVAGQRDPDAGQVECYWLAHGTVLIRADRQHVRRLLDSEGRMASSEELRQRRVVRMLDLDKVNRHQIDELDPHKDLDNAEEAAPPAGANDVKMSVHPTLALDISRPQEPAAASEEYFPSTPIEDDTIFEDALQDPPPQAPQPEQPKAVRNEDLPAVPEEFESATEEEMFDQDQQQDQPAAPAVGPSQLPQQSGIFAQRRQRMDLHETDFLRHPAFKHKKDDQLQSDKAKRQKATQDQSFSIDVFNLEDKTKPGGMQSWLPSGWNYDAKLNEFQLGETQDFWSLEHGFLVRHHVLGRSSIFSFDRDTLQNMPVPISSLQKYKITKAMWYVEDVACILRKSSPQFT